MEIRRGFAALLLALACWGCGSVEEAPPISEERMTDLLVDLHLAHAQREVRGPDSTAFVDSLLTRHGVTRSEFDASLQYYASHPDEYVAVMDSVIDRMRIRRPSADADGQDPLYKRPFVSAFRDTLEDLRNPEP